MATANGSTWDSYLPRVPAHAPRFRPGRPRRRHHCPTLVTEGEGDFAGGQSRQLYELLACPKAYRAFTEAEGTSGHMEGLGQQVWDGYVFDWLDATLTG